MVRNSSPTQALIAEGVIVHSGIHPIVVFSSDTGGKNAPTFTPHRQREVDTGR